MILKKKQLVDIILNKLCWKLVRGQTGKFVSRNRDLGCATFSERARRRAKFKNIASGAQILKVRAQKMKIV